MGGIGWMVEDHLVEIVNLWRRHLARELPGLADPALGYAAPVFLRELSRALREDDPAATNPFRRCELLLKMAPGEGLSGLVHEFRLLRRALWDVLRAHGRLVSPQERSVADEKIDEAIAIAVGRLAERPADREARPRNIARIAAEARGEGRGKAPRIGDDTPAERAQPKTLLSPLPKFAGAPATSAEVSARPLPAGVSAGAMSALPMAPSAASRPMAPVTGKGRSMAPAAGPARSPVRSAGSPAPGGRPLPWRAPWRRGKNGTDAPTPPPLPIAADPIPEH